MRSKIHPNTPYRFSVISETEYEDFWKHHLRQCFLSSPKIRYLTPGARIYFLGIRNNVDDRLVAAAMVRGTKRKFGFYDFFAPYGALMDYNNEELVRFFTYNIKKFLKRHQGYVFRMNPNIELYERDIDGRIVQGGIDNSAVVETLRSLGFKKCPYVPDLSQIVWQFVLPLDGKTSDGVLADMRQSTRRCIRKAQKADIKIRDLGPDEIEKFYNLLVQTADRKHFIHRDLNYFQKMYEIFSPTGEIRFVVAVINSGDDPDEEIILSGGMFMLVGKELVYVFGANNAKYFKQNAAYLLQWHMINFAIENGFSIYNFYGIRRNIDRYQYDGVYQFKKGFSGRVVELIGEYELPLSVIPYYLNKMLHEKKGSVRFLFGIV